MKGNKKIMIIGGVITTCLLVSSIIALGYYTSESPSNGNNTPLNENHNTIYLTIDDNSTTVSLETGDVVVLTLKDYGDGGYHWDITALNQDILKLDERTHEDGSGMLGDFGN